MVKFNINFFKFSLAFAGYSMLLGACGTTGTTPPVDQGYPQNPASQAVTRPVTDQVLLAEDPFAGPDSHQASSTFLRFFLDSVNSQSIGRWTIENLSGKKQWGLSNTCFSEPKAWLIGGNYWRVEDDTLTSNAFNIPADAASVKLTFRARWSIGAGDAAVAELSVNGGDNWTQYAFFSGGTNPSYPAWDKYLMFLNDDVASAADGCRLRFRLTSDSLGVGWGIGIDDIAVYQTNIGSPISLAASDGTVVGGIRVSWDVAAGGIAPQSFDVLRSTESAGSYAVVSNLAASAREWTDPTRAGEVYWYKVVARRSGYADQTSATDSGYAPDLSWYHYTLAAENAQSPSLAYIDGRPSMAYTQLHAGNPTLGELMYVRSSTPYATIPQDWGVAETVYTTAGSEFFQPPFSYDMAEIDGLPAIAFDLEGMSRFYESSSASGLLWSWSKLPVDYTSIGQLTVLDGKPAVVSMVVSLSLPFVGMQRAQDVPGSLWNDLQTIGPGTPVGSLAFIDGYPAQASRTSAQFSIQRATNPDGSGAWDAYGDPPAESTTFLVANNVPVVGYVRNNSGYIRTGDATCTQWDPEIAVAALNSGGLPVSATAGVVGNRAMLVYAVHDRFSTDPGPVLFSVYAVRALDGTAQTWGAAETVCTLTLNENPGDTVRTLQDLALEDVGGTPAITGTLFENGVSSIIYAVQGPAGHL